MAKPATGKWPRVQLNVYCRTCDVRVRFSVYYGESTIWGNSGRSLAKWAQHEEHDVDVQYEFYHGRKMTVTGEAM